MKSFFASLLTMEAVLTLGVCVALEALILFIVYPYFHDIVGAFAFSFIVLGPVSLLLGPPLYRYLAR